MVVLQKSVQGKLQLQVQREPPASSFSKPAGVAAQAHGCQLMLIGQLISYTLVLTSLE
jgi:hypothetical protein